MHSWRRGALIPRVHLSVAAGLVLALVVVAAPSGRELHGVEPVGRYSFSRPERCFLKKINTMRKRHGRSALNWDKQLGYVARRHARRMAADGTIYHDGNLGQTVTHWKRLGDNVGRGSSCKGLFRAFKRSAGHRSNILGTWRHMGVGVKRRGGNVFVMHVFESRRNPGNRYNYP